MAAADSQPCPSSEMLAAYVEGCLDGARRGEVQGHLITCTECLIVVRETSAALADAEEEALEESESDAHRLARHSLAVAACVALVVALAGWLAYRARDPLASLQRAAEKSPTRSIEGRLRGFPYAKFDGTRGVPVPEDESTFAVEVRRIRRMTGIDARAVHARGIAALLAGDTVAAVEALEAAVRMAPQQPSFWSDASAAQLAAGSFLEARSSASRAIALDSTLPEAYFNLALAHHHLGSVELAIEALDASLRHDSSPDWTAETRTLRDLLHNSR
jgi:tetratricopeptide (TPR) repeat protein